MLVGLDAVSERAWDNLGILFGVVAAATIGHQVLHEWRTPGPSSVSIWFVAGFLGIYFFWLLYGIRFRRRGIWLPNAMAVVLYALFGAIVLAKG
ncbi:MAG TPA: hypothetical protein VK911_13100 [Vicinamibacterales bacterium]|nr:hypothetical protein [Vicinamibacterales bacterium]